MNKKQTRAAIKAAVRKGGGVVSFAALLSEHGKARGKKRRPVSRFQVYRWQKSGVIPGEFVRVVEEITGISRQRLRPDLYPPA